MPRSKSKVQIVRHCRNSAEFEQYVLSRDLTEEPMLIAKHLMQERMSVKGEDIRRTTRRVEAIRRTNRKPKYGN
jgi:hypothetical protein